jgi:hypothetical protein
MSIQGGLMSATCDELKATFDEIPKMVALYEAEAKISGSHIKYRLSKVLLTVEGAE